MRYLTLLLLPLLLLTACDGTTDSDTIDTERINDIFDEIKESFNNHDDVSAIMAHYSENYLHDGDGLSMAQVVWDIRLTEYFDMEIVNLEIEPNGTKATASFELHLTGTSGEDIFLEPYDNGDLSYFKKEDGVWKVYGNQNPGEGNNLYINSSPEGARIYLDNSFMQQYTPATLHSVTDGAHVLRLYKQGWNEFETTIDVQETLQLDYTLTSPDWPKPIFSIDSPTNGMTTNGETTPVDAIVQVQDDMGDVSDFDGEYVVISVNGDETVVATDGLLHAEVALQEGDNAIYLRATGAAGNTSISDTRIVTRN